MSQHTPDHEDCYACAKEAQDGPLAARDAEIARLRAALEEIRHRKCYCPEGAPDPCYRVIADKALRATPTKPETP